MVLPDLALGPLSESAGDGLSSAAVPELAEAHFGYVWRLCRRLGLSESDADDAAQQVFITAARRLSDIRAGRERAFLYGVAVNVVAKSRHARARLREAGEVDLDALESELPSVEELSDQRAARALLDRVLDAMSLDLRAVFVLYEIEEQTVAEIAETLAIPVGTASSRLRRAREDFAARLARLEARRRFSGATR
ncbi:MAG TPA: sigma-70 family RNA polymerase sigma factor [Polyangiaceae bacterium]|nr:sigma-70 family RNA polymerase sigma factor [Polyangiaceae bacterium]